MKAIIDKIPGGGWLTLGFLMWSIEITFRKPVMADAGPWASTFLTMLIIPLCIWMYKPAELQNTLRVLRANMRGFLILGAFTIAAFVFFFMGVEAAPLSLVTLASKIQALFIVALAAIMLGEKLSLKSIPFIFLGAGGLLLLSWPAEGIPAATWVAHTWGLAYAVIAAIFWALCTILAKQHMSNNIPPLTFTSARFALCAVLMLPLLAFYDWEIMAQPAVQHGLITIGWTSILTTIGFIFYYMGLHRVAANQAGLFEFIMPVFVVILSYFFLGEQLTMLQGVGGACVVASCVGIFTIKP